MQRDPLGRFTLPVTTTSPAVPVRASTSRVSVLLALVLFAFIVTITILADVGHHDPIFDLIRTTPYGDKVCHFLFFGLFAFFVHRSLGFRSWRLFGTGGVGVPVGPLVILTLATLEELSQQFFPYRTLDVVDWLADFAGISLFTWLAQRGR